MGILNKIIDPADIIKAIGDALDKVITNKEELLTAKLEVEKEVNRHAEELEKIKIQDTKSAREMQIAALNQNDLFSKRFMYFLAAFIILSATAFGIVLFFYPIPENNKRLIEMFADVYLFAGALSVIYFFFGSSKSSQDKNFKIQG